MASSDEAEAFDVERILAEKIENGVTKYLVKWQGYADEECTWEPPENFDTSETLELWNKQKANGDTLEDDDLRRIQDQMNTFQAAQSVAESASGHTSEGQSDPEFDEPVQPPAKRLKMVHDPPPLTNKSRGSKNPARVARKVSEVKSKTRSPVSPMTVNSKDGNANAVHRKQISKQGTTLVADRPTASLSKSVTTTESSMTKSREQATRSKPLPGSGNIGPPTTFHAPELRQRKRRVSNANTKRDAVGKPFKNLRHLNNARKRQAERFEHLTSASTSNSLVESDKDPTQISGQAPDTQTNDSWLFFSDDDTGEMRGSEAKQRHKESGPEQVLEKKADIHNNESQAETVKTQENADQNRMEPQPQPQPSSTPLHVNPQPLAPQDSVGQESGSIQNTGEPTKLKQEPRSGEVFWTSETSTTANAEQGAYESDLHNRNATDVDQEASMQLDDPGHTTTSELVLAKNVPSTAMKVQPARRSSLFSQPASPIIPTVSQEPEPAVVTTAPSDRLPHPPTRIEEQRPQWRPQYDQSVAQTYLNRQNVFREDNIVRAASGREWVRGDLVIELFLQDTLAGGVKIQHLPWAQSSEIVRLKPKKQHNLPINFKHTITHAEYQAINKVSSWWTTFAVGAVEAFPNSEHQLSSLAEYLELQDLAACWWHPDPSTDLMLLLYSCRSPSWGNLPSQRNLRTRSGELRLNIAFRNKFKLPQADLTQQDAHARRQSNDRNAIEDGDTNMNDATNDFRREPRSRRASLVSNASSHAHDDLTKSPSEQLTREMADYALGARSRRASIAADKSLRPSLSLKSVPNDIRQDREDVVMTVTASPNELDHPLTSTDPRARSTADHRKESFDRHAASSSANNEGTSDTTAQRPQTSTTNSPIEGDTNPCLDRRLMQLSRISRSTSSRDSQGNVRVLVVHKQEDLQKAQEIQEWLARQVPDESQVKIQSVDIALIDQNHEAWKQFKSYATNNTCVLICDVNCPVYRFDNLARAIVDHDNILCWQVDLRATDNKPLKTTRMFPTGWAVAIAQDCFLVDPENVIWILKWLKKRVEQPFSASILMLPPYIGTAVQEQALISSSSATKTTFLRLAALIQELIGLSETRTDHLEDLGFSIILPKWEDVYSDDVARSNQVSAAEQKHRDRTMSDEFFKYFGAWAMKNLTKHRRFMGFTMGWKPQNNEHVRFQLCQRFVEDDKKEARAKKERQRSRSRDPSVGREHERVRGRSQDRGGTERVRAESRSRA